MANLFNLLSFHAKLLAHALNEYYFEKNLYWFFLYVLQVITTIAWS